MSKKFSLIIIILVFIIISLILIFYPLSKIPDMVIYGKNNSVKTLEDNKPIAEYKNGYNFEKVIKEFYSHYEFVYTNVNPINPTITLVYEDKNKAGVDFEIYKLQRKNLFEYQIYSRRFGYTRDYTYEQTLEFAKKQNLAENNPDPSKIVIKPQIQTE